MNRRFVGFAFAASLLLCTVIVVLWVCSSGTWYEVGKEKVWSERLSEGRWGPFACYRSTRRAAAYQGAVMLEFRFESWSNVLGPWRPESAGTYLRRLKTHDGGVGYAVRGSFDRPVIHRIALPGLEFVRADVSEHWGVDRAWCVSVRLIDGLLITMSGPLLLLAMRVRSTIRSARMWRMGVCRNCGYDLRATPDRCPECGHALDEVAG